LNPAQLLPNLLGSANGTAAANATKNLHKDLEPFLPNMTALLSLLNPLNLTHLDVFNVSGKVSILRNSILDTKTHQILRI
jgi:hypothetical protein